MLILKGFAPNTTLVDNAFGQTNAVGELSSTALTYSTEKGYYANRDIAEHIVIVAFACRDGDDPVELDPDLRDQVLEVINSTYQYAFDNQTVHLNIQDYTSHLYATHNTAISDLTFGLIVDDGRVWLPSRVSFSVRNFPENKIDIWLADNEFRNQYPLTEIKVIAPFENLNDFFAVGSVVEENLKAISPTVIAQRMQDVRAEAPETYMRIDMFDYHDPNNSTRIVPSPWGVLVYGITGNTIDAIKEALIDYILSNSNRTRDEWAEILPDIFKKHEFVICPAWTKYAIPNKVTQAGIYSPFISAGEVISLNRLYNPDYGIGHVQEHAITSGFPYRSLAVVSIGHIENRNDNYKLSDYFPDWINTNTNQDFNRMTERTRAWALKLSEAVSHAEDFATYDNIPNGFMKVIRNDRLFLTFSFEGINYLVLCKSTSD